MIHASAEMTVAIVAPAAMETVETVKKVGTVTEETVDTIAEAVETELTTDIKEEIEGKMEINEESGVKVASIDEKIAAVAEKADDSTVREIKKESWTSGRVDSMTTAMIVETDANAHVTGNRANAATTAATGAASFAESAKAAAIGKEDATSKVTGSNAKIDRRGRDSTTTTTTGARGSIDRATIDAGAMTMTAAIDEEADAAREAAMTIAPTTVQRGSSTSRRVSRPTKKLKTRSLSKKARISTNTTMST